MAGINETYDMLLKLVKTRTSVRKFRSDPIPDDTIDKILEVADMLEISYKTVANTTSLLKQKLGAKSHSDLIRIAVEMELR